MPYRDFRDFRSPQTPKEELHTKGRSNNAECTLNVEEASEDFLLNVALSSSKRNSLSKERRASTTRLSIASVAAHKPGIGHQILEKICPCCANTLCCYSASSYQRRTSHNPHDENAKISTSMIETNHRYSKGNIRTQNALTSLSHFSSPLNTSNKSSTSPNLKDTTSTESNRNFSTPPSTQFQVTLMTPEIQLNKIKNPRTVYPAESLDKLKKMDETPSPHYQRSGLSVEFDRNKKHTPSSISEERGNEFPMKEWQQQYQTTPPLSIDSSTPNKQESRRGFEKRPLISMTDGVEKKKTKNETNSTATDEKTYANAEIKILPSPPDYNSTLNKSNVQSDHNVDDIELGRSSNETPLLLNQLSSSQKQNLSTKDESSQNDNFPEHSSPKVNISPSEQSNDTRQNDIIT